METLCQSTPDTVRKTVQRIERLLSKAATLQKPYVERICPKCDAPCCLRVHYLYTDKDIIYLKLSGRALKWKRESFMKKGCRFLGEQGCTLDLASRPFLCHTYLCTDLKEAMGEQDPGITAVLETMFKRLGDLRSQLWSEYLDAIR